VISKYPASALREAFLAEVGLDLPAYARSSSPAPQPTGHVAMPETGLFAATSQDVVTILRSCDGKRSVAELAELHGVAVEDLQPILDALAARDVVV
jgi:hypothetical protein